MLIRSLLVVGLICLASPRLPAADYKESDRARLRVVEEFVNNVLTHAADRYNSPATPLLADGVHLETREHLKWRFSDGTESVISSFSSQQNFLRVLTAMTALTGNPRYEQVARDNIAYYFARYQEPNGLLQWGGHRFIDLQTLKVAGPLNKSLRHEMKSTLPYYELMYRVNPKATEAFISGLWKEHVLLEGGVMFDRHNAYETAGSFRWDAEPDHRDEVLVEKVGLTFITTGDDLIYSAAMLGVLSGNPRPWHWARRVAGLYQQARDPKTQLGVYQFTNPKKLEDESMALSPERRFMSKYGDRASRQIGILDGFQVTESSVLFANPAHSVYVRHSLVLLNLAGMMKGEASPYTEWTASGLKAFARYAYLPESNRFKPILTNGRDMSGYKMEREGYYGKPGTEVPQYDAKPDHLLAYVRAFCAAPDSELWAVIRSLAKGLRVGDLGEGAAQGIALSVERTCDDPAILFALLDLYKKTEATQYLEGARKVGDNIVAGKFRNGFFVPLRAMKYANIDVIEPLALLALDASIQGKSELVPAYVGSTGFIHGEYLPKGGKPRNIVDKALYVGVDPEASAKK